MGELADLFADDTAPAANMALRFGIETPPDQAAEAAQLARRYRIPAGVALEFREDYKRRAQVEDAQAVVERSPKLRSWLAEDFNRSNIAHDDIQTLGSLEAMFGSLRSGAEYVFSHPSRQNTLLGDIGAGVYGASRGAAGVGQAAAELPAPLLDFLEGNRLGGNPLRRLAEGFAGMGAAAARKQRELSPPQQGMVAGGVSAGVQSLVQNTVALPLALMPGGQGAALAVMAGGAGGQAYQEAREQGVPMQTALPFAASQAAIEYATEKLPVSWLIKDIGAGAALGRTLLRQMAAEVPGEQVATVLQDLNEWAILPENQDKTVGDYLAERPGAAAQTLVATLVGVGGNVAVMKSLDAVTSSAAEREARAQDAERAAATLEQASKLAAASRLNTRDAVTFKEFIAQAAEENSDTPTELFIDGQTLLNTLNQSGVSMAELEAIAPVVAAQLNNAQTGDVRVPLSEFMAAGEEITAPLVDHLRVGEDAMTRAEAREYLKEQGDTIRAQVEQALQQQEESDQFRQSVESVRQQFEKELNAAGRFTSDVNKAYASLLSNFYGATASRLGITPQELAQRYGLRVTAQEVGGAQTLDQASVESPEFKRWFGDSKVVDADGNPRVVYHGTRADFNAFDLGRQGQANGLMFSRGIYMTADPAYAEMMTRGEAGGNIMPSYVSLQNPLILESYKAAHQVPTSEWARIERDHDGVIVKDEGRLAEVIAFRPEQIKSATGNRGTFDPNDANILNQGAVPAAEVSTDESGYPEIRSRDIELRYAQPTERLEFIPEEGQQLYNLAIMSPEGRYLGYVELVFEDGRVSALYDIEVDKDARMGGLGAKAIEAILASNPDADILISNIVPAARGFWEKVGIPQQNVGEGDAYDANLNWETFAKSQAGRKSLEARRDQGQGGGDIAGAEGGGRPAPGGVLEQGQVGGARARIALPPDLTASPAVISLLKGADLSSFIHEGGHFFLEVTSDLASRIQGQIRDGATVSPAERAIVDDLETLLKWFGVEGGLAEWERMSFEQKTGAHEQFARGFEAYAFEGKAPSVELQTIFQRFRSWLVNVYKQLRNLNVELTDDVRAVMGRMLASEAAIEEAEAQRNLGPLFESAESAGMTMEEYQAYQGLAAAATDKATADLDERMLKDMKWLSRARDKAIKAKQQEVDDLRRQVRREVTSEILSQPVYRAWQFLSGKADAVDTVTPGVQPVGEIDTLTQKGKLRTSAVKELAPEQWDVLSKRRMTSEDKGMHPELVAELFGFDSGDALVQALIEARPPSDLIDEATDQQMLERYGDIGSEQALQRAADEAVHNEMRARTLAAELKALQAAGTVREDTGRRTREGARVTVDVLARAARQYAADIVARLRIRDIRPSQYTAAETRAAKLAQKAFSAGKTEEAALHKRNQLVNNYAAKAAMEAQNEVQAAVRYARRFDKRSKSIDPSYMDQIEQLLERFDFRPVSLKDIDRRKSLADWYAEQVKQGAEPSLPQEVLNEANRKSYKDMTLEELRGLIDSIKQIEHLGRLKNRLLTAKDQRDFDAAAREMAGSIAANGGEAKPVDLEGPNPVIDWFAGVAASHRKLASLFRQMDGNRDDGPMYRLIGRAMNERGTMEDVAVEKATVRLREIYAPVLKLKGGITGYQSKRFIQEINASLTRGGRLAVALNWGNEANRQRVMSGDGWSEAQVNAILRTLSPAELKFVNEVWEFLDSYWPEIAAKEKRLTGVEPEKVEAQPFTATASDGTQVQMRGGYYPLKYDAARSDRTDQQEAAQAAKEMMQGAFTRATTRRGHTKARLEEVRRPVRKDLNVITQHVTQVVHDLAWHEWLIDTNRLLGDERVAGAIRSHYGQKVLKTIRDDILGIATADVVPQTDIDKALLVLRSNVTRATMGASLTTAFLQPFGLTQSMVRIGPKHVLRGLARWGGDAARMENTVGWIRGKSEFMRLRSKTFNRELREIKGSVAGKSKVMQAVDGGLFWMMQKMQLVADVPTWVGQYEKSIAAGLSEDAAVAMADRAVLEAQGGGQIKDLSEVQRKHPMLTQFYSYFSTTLNLAAEQTAATDFKNPRAVAGWLGDMALLMVIPAIVPSFLLHALKGGDDDEEKLAKRIVEWQVGYLLGTVVGLRELSGAVSGYDYAGPPVGRIVSDIGKAGKQTAQGELDEAAITAYARLIGDAFGIPVTQVIRSYKGWKAWDEGDAPPQSVLFGPPPKD
jgi:hypothetical protein